MKHLKLLVSTYILLLCCFAASAHDFFSGGCYFNIIDYENALVEIANAGEGLFLKPGYTGDVVIPETVVYDEVTYQVVKIGYHAFYDCDITSVRIPASIQDIDCGYWGTRSAFSNCEKLESIVVDEYNLWYDSRDNCNAIIRTETNTLIAGCKNTVIPASVTAIGRCAFDQNSNLESIEIPNSVTLVDTLAFCECTNLTNIMFSDESQLTTIGLSAFNKCSNLTSINLPLGVTLIESQAFSECCNLTSVEFPEDSQLTTIGIYAFRYCSGLTSIEIPNSVTSIGYGAFEGCTGLTSIEIPNSVTSIGYGAFEGCTGLTSIEIPNSVTGIGDGAFEGCTGLTSIEIPNSVTSIGTKAFYGCSNLKTVINLSNLTFSKGSSDYGYVAYYANMVINAPNVVFVGDFIFFTVDGKHTLAGYLGNETEITLPSDYNGENYAIGSDAFHGCSGLTSITIPSSVTSIGDGAFEGCTGLTSIEIPNSVTSIGNNAFNGCTSLTDLRIEDGESTLSLGCSGDGYVLFYYCPLRALYLGRNLSYTTDYYSYSPFRNIKTLTSITIGNNVTSIGVYAFSGCTGLTSIEIPNSVTSIGDGAFDGCTGLTSIEIPNSVVSIGNNAFNVCTSLTDLRIEDGESTLSLGCSSDGYVLFYYCPLRALYLGRNLSYTIDYYSYSPFRNIKTLTSITIGNNVTSIGVYAFSGCTGLTSIEIPNSVTSIGDGAFEGCTGLTSIEIPNSVTSIGDYAFRDCSCLTKLICKSTIPPSLGSDVFTNYSRPLYVPSESVNTYMSTPGWSSFTNIGELKYKVTYIVNGDIYTTRDVAIGSKIPTDIKEGYTFVCDNMPTVMPSNDITVQGSFTVNSYVVKYIVDGEVFATDSIAFGAEVVLREQPTKEGHTFSGWSEVSETMPANDITIEGLFTVNSYAVHYVVDGAEIAVDSVAYGNKIVLREYPSKEGHTFSGWSEVPATMPAEDIVIEGTFTVNSYVVKYVVDGEEFASDSIAFGAEIVLREQPTKEGHTFSGWSEVPETMPAKDVTIEGTFTVNGYVVKYIVDGEEFATDSIAFGSAITLRVEPTKEGYTFSGWSEAPATMPAENIVIEGTFAVNSYVVKYVVDGEEFASDSIAFSSEITLRELPTREGHTFSGWSEVPETMPAKDVTIEGTFTVNSYVVKYIVDGEEFATDSIAFGAEIVLREQPTKEGHTFSGWSEVPETMPANDITIEGTFTVNSYVVKYIVDGEEFATDSIAFGAEIVLREQPTKKGHIFSGWSEVPETMPANDITIEGLFTVNSYAVHYVVDGAEIAVDSVAYGNKIVLREYPSKEGHTFSGWSEAPETMPAEDVTIVGTFAVNSYTITYVVDGEEYKVETITYGSAITLIDEPTKEGHTFSGWSETPATMPAENITITGSFAVNYYTIIYIVDGGVYKTVSIEYGAEILLEDEPTKDGCTFSGWSEAPETMPAEDIIITGSFILNVVDVISIVLDKSSIVLNVGDEVTLIATITPDNATDKSVIWYTSNPFVATVEDGVVTSVGEGDAVITALAGNKVAICIVKVLKNDTSIDSVNGDSVTKEVIYDLNGNRIVDAKNLNNGIYIINGKKVLVK